MNEDVKYVYITKYALTAGILRAQLERVEDGYVVVKDKNGLNGISLYHGQDWWMDERDALDRVDEMINRKMKSLDRQIRQLQELQKREKVIKVVLPE